ncbi:uncharacterized protein isoform X2 [Musca autumnalis]|uniref:uncharacterized protein isoform X2 n=1 Tax=Musca autumnalis TaxID=221902 RepID=UPI003CEDF51F
MLDIGIAKDLELKGNKTQLSLQWLNEHSVTEDSEVVDLKISGMGKNDRRYVMKNIYTTSNLSLPIQSCNLETLVTNYNNVNVSKIKFDNYKNVKPKLIISLHHCFLTVPLDVPRSLSAAGPIVTTTRLGVVVYGPTPGEKVSTKNRALHARMCAPSTDSTGNCLQQINWMMQNYFDVETLGVKVTTAQLLSADDERAMELLKKHTRKVGERYECRLLWKQNVPPFPDSFEMALKRLYSVENKMARDIEYGSAYCEKINDYISKGYCRKIEVNELPLNPERVFYLPHFGVKNVNKKGIRIVFDAAAEVKNVSLNKCLLSGPDINNSLISTIFKFREAPIAVCGDIKEMFHQVKIAKEDQDCQRFLWRNGDKNKRVETYVMQRMIFGATCSPTIAQYVKNMNANMFEKESPRAVEAIVNRHYVDDYVDCFQTEEEAAKVVKDVVRIHSVGGFELRNIISNSQRVIQACGESASGVNDSDFSKIPTKRQMLSLNMSIYDPFGFVCEFMVASKILMQKVWKSGIEWDEELPSDLYSNWKLWLGELNMLEEFRIPRCYLKDFSNRKVDLHIFADASEEAMATVAYWRVVSEVGINVSFVMGKSACAPTRYHTIPKLELQAAVMGVRMKDLIVSNHVKSINKIYFWTDSHTVIRWIHSDHRKYKQYVANRVAEILESSGIHNWNWCPGILNPADEATRAKFPVRYEVDGRWKNGPEFLRLPESQWPSANNIENFLDASDSELRSKHVVLVARQCDSVVPDITRFSKYRRYRRTMAWMHRYIQNFCRKFKKVELLKGELSAEEEAWAEQYLCRNVQMEVFADEIADIGLHGHVSKDSKLKMLNPVIGPDKLLRVSGRIENAPCLPNHSKNPIILPNQHPFTRLLVESYHLKFCHINKSTVIAEVHLKFWVPSLRRLLNSIQSRCQVCRIRRSKPCQPQMGLLPIDRVTPYVRPFTYTGLDYFGPVTVTIRRQREKRWVALFTCLTVRAIHLEIAADLSSDACLLCIRNFINRRGAPLVIRSDNGTNFVGIEKELNGEKGFIDNNVMTSSLSALGIQWKFNTPANPSEGGAWERLVQSVKKSLNAMLREHSPRFETLQSFLIEAENMINSRPLTHLAVSPEDPDPLTPNHFLLGCANSTQTPAPFEPRLMSLRKQWRIVKNLRNGMWHQWVREYLPDLTRRTKWCLPTHPLNVGTLVFICDADLPRSQWKRGRIVELFHGKDGVARSAKVNTSSGIYRRPISKLAVLDVDEDSGEASPSGSVHGGGDVGDGHLRIGNAS